MATAELAVCLPVLMLVLAAGIGLVAVVSGRVHVQDAAREAARAAARGDTVAATRLAQRAAPGSTVTIGRDGDDTQVRVRITIRPLGGLLPAVTVTGAAVAAAEPDAPP